jgi:hypothetical protein
MNDYHRTPNKEDAKPAAQPDNEDSSPSPESNRRKLRKQEHESDHMKKITTYRKHPKTTQRTGRKTHNGNRCHETSQLGHTNYFNNKDNNFPNNE